MIKVVFVATTAAVILTSCQSGANIVKATGDNLRPVSGVVIDGYINPEDAHWAHLPTSDDLAKVYPDQAARRNLSGKSRVHCKVEASGTLSACIVTNEFPTGLGFGEAELKIIHLFRMVPDQYGPKANTDVPISWNLVIR